MTPQGRQRLMIFLGTRKIPSVPHALLFLLAGGLLSFGTLIDYRPKGLGVYGLIVGVPVV